MRKPPWATLERIVPETLEPESATGSETLELHLARYRFAADQLCGGRILDLACGVGYGSSILAEVPGVELVVGGDLSASALRYAKEHFRHPRVVLGCGDYAGWLRPRSFRGIVSLETIEHVAEPRQLLQQFAALLEPGGVLVASVPVTPSVDANPHHRSDFTRTSFLQLGERAGFSARATFLQVQPYSVLRILARREARTQDLREGLLRYYAANPAAAGRRLVSTLRYGFTNLYLTVAWQKR